MNSALERWLHLPLCARLTVATASLAVITLGVWLLLIRPQQRAQQTLRVDLAALNRTLRQQQAQLDTLPAESVLRSQLDETARQLAAHVHAAPLDAMLAARGGQLATWQPESEPRTLILRMAWPEFQPLFAELANSAAPFPARFLLEARQGNVQATLWLESDDAR